MHPPPPPPAAPSTPDNADSITLSDPTQWTYLTRGANNILYYPSPTLTSIPPHHLLRLRISCPGTPTTLFLHRALQTHYLPALPPRSILSCRLVRLAPGFIQGLQVDLVAMQEQFEGFGIEGSPGRRRKGKVVRLEEGEEWGLLVEDMRLPSGPGKVLVGEEVELAVGLVEFKPKYLSQSADAPEGWTVCRTCAYRAKVGDGGGYCPLDLASGEGGRVRRAVGCVVETRGCSSRVDVNFGGLEGLMGAGLVDGEGFEERRGEVERVVRGFLKRVLGEHFLGKGRALVEALRRTQEEWGRAGVFPSAEEGVDPDAIWYALALVDCTIYLRVSVRIPLEVASAIGYGVRTLEDVLNEARYGEDVKIECKVGDLDPKVGTGAQSVFFKNQERSLSRGGYYFGEGNNRCCRDGRRSEVDDEKS